MSDPKRWMEEGPPEAVGRLLEAASAERPPEASLSRALTALGLGAGATGAATTASAATTGATTAVGTTVAGAAGVASAGKATSVVVASALVKWGLVGGALVAASVAGTAVVKRAARHDETERAQATLTAQAPMTRGPATSSVNGPLNAAQASPNTAEAAPSTPEAAPDTTDASPEGAKSANPSPLAAPLAASAPSAVLHPSVRTARKALVTPAAPANEAAAPMDAERLAEEVALVDRARGALARGDARGTLGALDDYDARFTPRKFVPEALYLRMEALLRLGQTSAARAVAERLATNYPSSPNAARARQVLGASIP